MADEDAGPSTVHTKPCYSDQLRKLEELRKQRLQIRKDHAILCKTYSVQDKSAGKQNFDKQEVATSDEQRTSRRDIKGQLQASTKPGGPYFLGSADQHYFPPQLVGSGGTLSLPHDGLDGPILVIEGHKISELAGNESATSENYQVLMIPGHTVVDESRQVDEGVELPGMDVCRSMPSSQILVPASARWKKRKKLHWGLGTKERWERKGNM